MGKRCQVVKKDVKYQLDILIVQLQYQMKGVLNPLNCCGLKDKSGGLWRIPFSHERDETNSIAAIPDEETYESTQNIFPTTIFPTSFSWETHQFFLHHFLGKPNNFSYLIFLGNPPIFPIPLSWESHQFFLPPFLGKPTNFSYPIILGNPPIFPTPFSWAFWKFG